jgi:hypothetical protein
LLFFALILQCSGHGWLTDPIPRGFVSPIDNDATASTSSPCGNLGIYNETINVTQYTGLDVSFLLGGGHENGGGPLICRFSIADTENQADFDQNIVANGITCRNGQDDGTITVPISAPTGIQYLQFRWLAGDTNWYNCIRLNVLPGTINTKPISVGAMVTEPVEELNITQQFFYDVDLAGQVNDGYKHLLVRINDTNANGIGVANVTASVQGRPLTYNAVTSRLTAANYIQSFSVCNIADGTQKAYVSVFPTLDYVGNVTFHTKIYDAELDFNTNFERAFVAESGETYVFYSEAYSEAGFPRKIVIEGRGADIYLSGPHNNCAPKEFNGIGQNCINLPPKNPNQNNQKRYYHVYFAGGQFNGKVLLKLGECGGVATIVISMILLMVVLFI